MEPVPAKAGNPVAGRFLSTDPIGYQDQFNLYAYVGNDPVNKTDPTGEFAMLAIPAACAGGGCELAVAGAVAAGAAIAAAAENPDQARRAAFFLRNAAPLAAAAMMSRSHNQNEGPTISESRSRPPGPLPEAEGRPHSVLGEDGGYTTHEEIDADGRSIEGKQYRPEPKNPGTEVKEWKGHTSPDGARHPGKPEKRPAKPEEVREPNR